MYNKATAVAVILAMSFSTGVFADDTKDTSGMIGNKMNNSGYHQAGTAETKATSKNGMQDVIKSKKLDKYQSATIGEAFEGYRFFETKEWKVTKLPNAKFYIDFTGIFKKSFFSVFSMEQSVSRQGLEIKFVVYEDGRFGIAMISKVHVMTDGMIKRFPLDDTKSILDKIYANKEIKF